MKIDVKDILPHDGESPSAFAERIGVSYSLAATSVSKKSKGQFFTPLSIAHFMSTKIVNDKNKITILDPGCGTAILSSALIEHLLIGISPKEITLVLYETDFELIPFLVKDTKTFLLSFSSRSRLIKFFETNLLTETVAVPIETFNMSASSFIRSLLFPIDPIT